MKKLRYQLYYWLRLLLGPLVRLIFPLKVEGLANIGDEPVILCPNHGHALDPILLILALPASYSMRIMAKKQLMEKPVLGAFLRKVGVFGIDRGNSDVVAVKTAISSLKSGWNLMIFPEGTRVKKQGEVEAKGGIAMMAIRSGVKLQPVYISPEQRAFHRTRIVIGKPYAPVYTGRKGTAEEYQANADEILRQAYALGETK